MPDDVDDDLFDRLRSGASGARPRSDSTAYLGVALARDRRRRTVNKGLVAAVVVLAITSTASLVALVGASDDGAVPAGPGVSSTDDGSPEINSSRPAKLFAQVLGGDSRGYATRAHLVPGERVNSQFEWWPEGRDGPGPYLAGIAIEGFRDDAACASLVEGGSACGERSGGDQVVTYQVPLGEAFYDPIHRAAPATADSPDAVVTGVTYLRADGLAVSAFVCTCAADGTPIEGAAPVGAEQLELVASDDAWVYGRQR